MSRIRLARPLTVVVGALLAVVALVPATAGAHTRTLGSTTLQLNPATAAALTSLGVTPGVIAPATANSDGSLSFPITDPLPAAIATGQITHAGGISLTAGSTVVDLTNFNINLRDRRLSAVVDGGARVAILDLDFSDARLSLRGGQLTVGPITASLTQQAASALNAAFGVTAFTKGLVLGTATVKYRLFPTFWP